MEEIIESFIRIVFGIIRWFFLDIIVDIILFNLGRGFLLLVTAGRYPTANDLVKDAEKILCCGVIIVIFMWAIIALYNNYA